MSSVKIEALSLYPVKSCGGLQLENLKLGTEGAETIIGSRSIGDREWMFLNASGKFLTQRDISKLSLIRPKIENDSLYLHFDHEKIEIPLDLSVKSRKQVMVWSAEVDVALVELSGIEKLSDFLGQSVSLVHFDKSSKREAKKSGNGLGVQTRFTDSQPYLVVSRESLQDLNSRMKTPIPMSRFRANIEISGASAFAEDHWQKLVNSQVELLSSKACGRCVMININQENSGPQVEMNPEALKTLAQFRRQEKNVFFGQYYYTQSFNKTLKIGDSLEAFL